jgi:hypothetical protein
MTSRGRAISGILAVIVLIAACGKSGGDAQGANSVAAESTVRSFFTALTAGDAKTAVSYLEPVPGTDPAGGPLLSDAALGAAYRPSDVQYGKPRLQDGLPFVDVTYQALGETVRQNVALSSDGKRLRTALVHLAVTGVQGRPVSVNGVKMGADDLNVTVFPGTYKVAVTGNKLFAGATLSATPDVASGGQNAAANFGPATLTASAVAEIQRKVRQGLDACAASSRPKTPGCPFWLDAKSGTVQWSITKYPSVKPQATNAGGRAVSLSDDGTGRAHWTANYVDKNGQSKFGSGDIPFKLTGGADASASGIKVSLT